MCVCAIDHQKDPKRESPLYQCADLSGDKQGQDQYSIDSLCDWFIFSFSLIRADVEFGELSFLLEQHSSSFRHDSCFTAERVSHSSSTKADLFFSRYNRVFPKCEFEPKKKNHWCHSASSQHTGLTFGLSERHLCVVVCLDLDF